MKTTQLALLGGCLLFGLSAFAQSFEAEFSPLVEASCLDCHDAETETRLNFEELKYDLDDPAAVRQWEKVFDRVRKGEMPPARKRRPDARLVGTALDALENQLKAFSLADQQRKGRVPSRRLTRLEHAYTIQDLLGIDESFELELPLESDSGGFDTVGASQQISSLHIQKYLQAADQALDVAIDLGKRPQSARRLVDYQNSPSIAGLLRKSLKNGGSNMKRLDDAIAMFLDLDYIMRSDNNGLVISSPGRYRVTVEAYAYQAKSAMVLKLLQVGARQAGPKLLGAYDLLPGKPRTIEVITFMQPGDHLYPSVSLSRLDTWSRLLAVGGAQNYQGEGISIKSLHVEGPLIDAWPPDNTRTLLNGLRLKKVARPQGSAYRVELTDPPMEHIRDVVARIAPLAFRRPPRDGEIDSFVDLARPAIDEGRGLVVAVRVPLRSILSSPQFIYLEGEPGELDDYALASRLSYFLWKSMPDPELFKLAAEGKLSDPGILEQQVDRMLNDEKSMRFVQDFLGQWLRLHDLNATTPDRKLYPEFDGLLGDSIRQETELFFADLIEGNLSAVNLIDSNHTFLNRRLARHYRIPGIQGQQMRKVRLAAGNLRGGILGQASIHKITANGTFTSPVKRGAFVLTRLLGAAPEAPPPDVGSIEPDTRGTTTIRETLAKHRNVETCAQCHRSIDPPGFALETFDPIGGVRRRYRVGGETGRRYRQGPMVDASGKTEAGETFSDFREYKQLLLGRKDQIVHHFISRLVVYATGAEIQFADRDEVQRIAEQTRDAGYPVRSIIHQIVQSRLFRNL
jgi:hypothetical protein